MTFHVVPRLIALLLIAPIGVAGAEVKNESPDAPAPNTKIDFNLYIQGRYVFERNCIICHGPKGDGNGEFAKDLEPKPRSFREGWFKYRSTPFDKLPTEDDLRRTITGGVSGTAMGTFTNLSSEEVTSVIEYVKSFSRRWRKAENHSEALVMPPPPDWFRHSDAESPRAHVSKGESLFVANCSGCHGAKADGKGLVAPLLRDGWGFPAKPADLHQPHLHCGENAEDIFRTLTTGMSGTPMLSFATILTEEQRWEIVAFIMSIRVASVPVINPSPVSKTPPTK